MISYKPLFKTLEVKNIQLIDLVRHCELSPRTVAKFRKNEPVNLTTIDRICIYLRVPIEKVVEITFDDSE